MECKSKIYIFLMDKQGNAKTDILPQKNFPIGWPGLARLPNNNSFLLESEGVAS